MMSDVGWMMSDLFQFNQPDFFMSDAGWMMSDLFQFNHLDLYV
jgi:hypothetical protein